MENIKIYTDEYSLFMKKYKQLHENIIIDLDYCYRELDILLHSDGGFHADMISEKLDIMMEILKCNKTDFLKVVSFRWRMIFGHFLILYMMLMNYKRGKYGQNKYKLCKCNGKN